VTSSRITTAPAESHLTEDHLVRGDLVGDRRELHRRGAVLGLDAVVDAETAVIIASPAAITVDMVYIARRRAPTGSRVVHLGFVALRVGAEA